MHISPVAFHFLSHEIQSRLMRVQSLQFLLERAHTAQQTAAEQEKTLERTALLTDTLKELSALENIQSRLSYILVEPNTAEELYAELQPLLKDWILRQEVSDEFRDWAEQFTASDRTET